MTDRTTEADPMQPLNPPLPLMPCDACMRDPAAVSITERLVAVYCPHHLSGLHYGSGLFTLHHPIRRHEYAAIVEGLEMRLQPDIGLVGVDARPN